MRIVLLSLFLFAGAAAADDLTRWDGADIRSRMIGNTIVGEARDLFGASFRIYFHPDGTTRGVAEKFSFTVTDQGRWEIDEDRICVQWSKWEGNDRLCRTTAVRDGRILMFDADGTVTSHQVIQPGNPYKL